ncbi:MAG: DUF3987 domain-containing protein [Rhodospirillales bacterium]|nr:DUF3987 domain-containing protein [Rhodospirillales bacterium]
MRTYAFYPGSQKIEWSEPDLGIIDNSRDTVPAVPLDLLPEPWRKWIADTASATGAPQDYVLQTVLAGVAGVCGAGVRVRVTPAWTEPLVMWQAMVGEPSTGKSAALAPMRRLLATIEQEQRLHDEERRAAHAERVEKGREDRPFVPSRVVMTDTALEAVAETVTANPRGVLLWRDLPKVWFGGDCADDRECAAWLEAWTAGALSVERRRGAPLDLASFPVSILQTMWPDSLKAALLEGDKSLPSRFLYAWPGPQDHCALTALEPVHDDEVLERLRRLSTLARPPDDPCELRFDERGVKALDGFLTDLDAARQSAEGLEAAWLGKSRAFIVRLAGIMELLGFNGGPRSRPGAIGSEQVDAAAALWRGYFSPHARAVFDSAELSDHKRRVRRVARWLRDTRPDAVSREEIRRRALSRAATAEETEHVLQRLHYLGYVQPDREYGGRGRPTSHWLVNPALAEA